MLSACHLVLEPFGTFVVDKNKFLQLSKGQKQNICFVQEHYTQKHIK